MPDFILRGLSAGNKDDSSTNCCKLDLCEIVAALIIPELLTILDEEQHNDSEETVDGSILDMIDLTLQKIANTVFGSDARQDHLILDRETVKQILVSLGEVESSQDDDLVCAMVEQAACGRSSSNHGDKETAATPIALNGEALACALTSDLHAYKNITIEDNTADLLVAEKTHTLLSCCKNRVTQQKISAERRTDQRSDEEEGNQSINEAVVVVNDSDENANSRDDSKEVPTDDGTDNNKASCQVKRLFTAKSIDYMIDAQASRAIAISLWIFLLLHILTAAGIFGLQDFPSIIPSEVDICSSNTSLGCDTLQAFLAWLDSIITLLLVGGIFVMSIGSLGNRVGTSCHVS